MVAASVEEPQEAPATSVEEPATAADVVPSAEVQAFPKSDVLFGELVGTFILALAGQTVQDSKLGPFAIASVLIGLIYGFGPLSKAVFNPAVSVALCLRGQMTAVTAGAYGVAQFLGSLLAGLVGWLIYGAVSPPTAVIGWRQAAIAEVVFTFVIVTAVMHTGVKAQKDNDVVGLTIGLTVFGCIVCSSGSGACFNPAIGPGVWLAQALVGGGFSWAHQALYTVFPVLGAILGWAIFATATYPNVEDRD